MKIGSTFLKKVHSLLPSKKVKIAGPFIHPTREWETCLFVMTITAIGLFTLAGVDFYRQLNDRDFPEVNEEHIPKYRVKDAEFLIRFYEGKQDTFESLRANKVVAPVILKESATSDGGQSNTTEEAKPVAGTITAE